MSRKRCAIYTRKSSEEGLEQEFNSLAAQREACEAFIRSQLHEGWASAKHHYDDGAFSGGNLERPALQRLLTDIRAGRIDIVIVYKGGDPPLGYDASERSLVINLAEAKTVRHLFALYLQLGCVRRVKNEADRLGLKTKRSTATNGVERGGKPFSRGHIYRLLSNPIYTGRIAHKGQLYPGQHPALIEHETWTAVRSETETRNQKRVLFWGRGEFPVFTTAAGNSTRVPANAFQLTSPPLASRGPGR